MHGAMDCKTQTALYMIAEIGASASCDHIYERESGCSSFSSYVLRLVFVQAYITRTALCWAVTNFKWFICDQQGDQQRRLEKTLPTVEASLDCFRFIAWTWNCIVHAINMSVQVSLHEKLTSPS